jgi:hypothetical protein
MQKIGYSLVNLGTGEEVMQVPALPARLSVPGVGVVDFDQAGQVIPDSGNPTHRIVERWGDPAPSAKHSVGSETPTFNVPLDRVEVARTWNVAAPTVDDVIAERTRRLALGFDYNFADARGVHNIGTTEADMRGWDEVAKAAAAFIALGQPSAEFTIVTNTGPATITALEFQSILTTAAAVRQPLWAASFTLQAMNPIPADYADNAYWS